MKSAAVIGLVAASVVLAGTAWLVVRPSSEPGTTAASANGEPFLKGLESKVNSVAAVVVKSGDKEFTVHQDAAGVWRFADKGDYPAQTDVVKQTVVGLASLKNAEPKTSKPDLYSKIGVEDPGAPAPTGDAGGRPNSLVTLKDSTGQTLASVIVGNSKSGGKAGVYVRRAGEAQSWLAEGSLDIQNQPLSWLETKVFEIPRDRVKSVTITHAPGGAAGPEGGVLVVSREKQTDTTFTVHDVPPGKELKSPSVGDPLAAGIAFFQFEDVVPAASFKTEGEGAAKLKWTADYRTFDGLILVIQAYDKDGKTWAKVLASFDDTSVAPADNRPPALKSGDDVKKEEADLTAKLSPWVFQLPDWKATTLAATMASMLKETPPAPPPGMTGTTSPQMSLPIAPPMSTPPSAAPPPPLPPPASPLPKTTPAPTGPTGPTAPTAPTAPTGG